MLSQPLSYIFDIIAKIKHFCKHEKGANKVRSPLLSKVWVGLGDLSIFHLLDAADDLVNVELVAQAAELRVRQLG